MQISVENWLKANAAGLYDEGIGKLVPRYEKCLRRSIHYVGGEVAADVWLNIANTIFLIFTVVLMSRPI